MSRTPTPEFIREKLQGSPYPREIQSLTLENFLPSDTTSKKDYRRSASFSYEDESDVPYVDDSFKLFDKEFYFSFISEEDKEVLKQAKCLQEICDYLLYHRYSREVSIAAIATYDYLPAKISTARNLESGSDVASTTIHSSRTLTGSSLDDVDLSSYKLVDSDVESEQ